MHVLAGVAPKEEVGGTQRVGMNRFIDKRLLDRDGILGGGKAGGDVGEMLLGFGATAKSVALRRSPRLGRRPHPSRTETPIAASATRAIATPLRSISRPVSHSINAKSPKTSR